MRVRFRRCAAIAVVAAALLSVGGCAGEKVPSSVTTPSIVVPDLVGVSAVSAHKQLDKLDLVTDFDAGDERVHDESEWVVTDTEPAAGTHVFWGAAIRVQVTRALKISR